MLLLVFGLPLQAREMMSRVRSITVEHPLKNPGISQIFNGDSMAMNHRCINNKPFISHLYSRIYGIFQVLMWLMAYNPVTFP